MLDTAALGFPCFWSGYPHKGALVYASPAKNNIRKRHAQPIEQSRCGCVRTASQLLFFKGCKKYLRNFLETSGGGSPQLRGGLSRRKKKEAKLARAQTYKKYSTLSLPWHRSFHAVVPWRIYAYGPAVCGVVRLFFLPSSSTATPTPLLVAACNKSATATTRNVATKTEVPMYEMSFHVREPPSSPPPGTATKTTTLPPTPRLSAHTLTTPLLIVPFIFEDEEPISPSFLLLLRRKAFICYIPARCAAPSAVSGGTRSLYELSRAVTDHINENVTPPSLPYPPLQPQPYPRPSDAARCPDTPKSHDTRGTCTSCRANPPPPGDSIAAHYASC